MSQNGKKFQCNFLTITGLILDKAIFNIHMRATHANLVDNY